MLSLNDKFLYHIEQKKGSAFSQHYIGDDPCSYENGRNFTSPKCMERGLGQGGVDCFGLIIVGVCEALDWPIPSYPVTLRHVEQLDDVPEVRAPRPCDIAFYYAGGLIRHAGVVDEQEHLIHATNRGNRVIVEPLIRFTAEVRYISVANLADLAVSRMVNS